MELPPPPASPIIGRESDRIHNELYLQWAEEYGVDPAEDPEFLRAWRRATGHDPETGLALGSGRAPSP
ncbi:hypothetical protein ACFHYQ_09015 [Sphaerimonospora cavernae]|uniref:Uncharacterized protein n=1 Tax=Sphaerimonospora cavernae TaxID=1740611 RepID=A0ABV6U5N3_9ACTN